ncbi:hypothetical protein T4B_4201 [Trichinella pseudospiralis]|uniref:Uncharacterized protein n=2 Tax=Trichinella pseudospiralis TaxID=6337 RepID=A0A0V1FRD8_TRIPS|nr:hypothetical protein T4D_11391 [Trichinella pseudospiralis]KRZ32564.1 hypothetical protein T4B_4201 [Trichinella pseudospiralis]
MTLDDRLLAVSQGCCPASADRLRVSFQYNNTQLWQTLWKVICIDIDLCLPCPRTHPIHCNTPPPPFCFYRSHLLAKTDSCS